MISQKHNSHTMLFVDWWLSVHVHALVWNKKQRQKSSEIAGIIRLMNMDDGP